MARSVTYNASPIVLAAGIYLIILWPLVRLVSQFGKKIGLGHYLTLGAIIFSIGIIGIFLNRKNIIVILMSIELILLAVNINLVAFSIFLFQRQ